ncbi:MAG TPA: glycosyl hydrolase 108 family protein [Xanthobacteraceae bacterium]|nr:glycosyl hydrolase 108 family protein [Xanthobacteraceae bacterium]
MAAANFSECLRRLLAYEGGYANHPSDPGGPTNFGITISDYRRYVNPNAAASDVKAMHADVARAIYRTHYWDALRCDDLPPGIDASIFDYGVNSGVGRSGKVLRRVLGLPASDYRVTAEVLAALTKRDTHAIINAVNDERMRFLKSLKTWPTFGAGWSRRVREVRAFSLSLAASRLPTSVHVPSDASPPRARAQSMHGGAAATTVAGAVIAAGGAASTQAVNSLDAAWIVIGAVMLALTLWFALRWWRKRTQTA